MSLAGQGVVMRLGVRVLRNRCSSPTLAICRRNGMTIR
jgi:hypothetical protein